MVASSSPGADAPTAPRALDGVRVVDLSRILAGPWCTQLLADLGADVIKIERPGTGDDTRQWGPPWLENEAGEPTRESAYYLAANRGKRSVTVDIGSDQGRGIVEDLVVGADVFVENFKRGGLAAKGLGYDQLRKINPGLIYLSITGFGQTGPRADQPGYDYLAQSLGGLMSITGPADGEPGAGPVRAGVAVSDLGTGLYSTVAVLAALLHKRQTGEGQHIDMALLDTQVALLANQATNFLVGGTSPVRTGAWHPNLAPYQPFDASDASFIVAVGNDRQFGLLCDELDCSELVDDVRFVTNPDRNAHREELAALLQARFVALPRAHWLERLPLIGVPASAVNSIADVFEEPQVRERGGRIDLPHTTAGSAPGVANPMKLSGTPVAYNNAPPLLGEHTDEVLAAVLGYAESTIEGLRSDGVI